MFWGECPKELLLPANWRTGSQTHSASETPRFSSLALQTLRLCDSIVWWMQEQLCCQKKVTPSVLPASGPLRLQVLGANSNWLEIIHEVHFKDTESFMELGGGQKSTCEPHGKPKPSRKPAEIGSHFFSASFLCSRFMPASFLTLHFDFGFPCLLTLGCWC